MIRVGLLGHGQAGCLLHGPLIEAAGGFRITAVATSRTASLSERRDAPRQESRVQAVIDADDVDMVVVATPNDTHYAFAAAALRAGKHVVVDKPLALSTADADRLIALAKTQRRVLTVFQNRRLDGDYLAVRDVLASGELGQLMLFEARWDRFRPVVTSTWKNQPGGGVLWDLGSHLIDQALQLFGSPDSITADLAAQRDGAMTDDYFELTLRYGPMRCLLSASCVVAAARPRFALHGTKRSFLTFGVDPVEQALQARHDPSHPSFPQEQFVKAELVAPGERELRRLAPGNWVEFYRGVSRAIREGIPPQVDPTEIREVIAIVERAYESVRV